ncbi:Uncharacterised protein [Trueperella pyogenes]|nr:hypothetical protein [Trueperella pyogenes]SUO87081.1 Uncharacterised protein [Trueperella pyogenes]
MHPRLPIQVAALTAEAKLASPAARNCGARGQFFGLVHARSRPIVTHLLRARWAGEPFHHKTHIQDFSPGSVMRFRISCKRSQNFIGIILGLRRIGYSVCVKLAETTDFGSAAVSGPANSTCLALAGHDGLRQPGTLER